jgi:uncharacterized membrane protein (DUF485 family)
MPSDSSAETNNDAALAGRLMRRQAALSLRVAAVFLVLVFGVPLLNQYVPEWGRPVLLGFPLSWFLLALLFYPLTWLLSIVFVRSSERLETDDAEMVRRERPRP